MEISIRSEADSRCLVYPLLKALYNYGTIVLFTTNRSVSRLIENEEDGGFKNIRIIVSPEADLDGAKDAIGFHSNDYDFVIYDNIGAVDYDMLIAMVTNRLSDSYVQDLLYICSDPKTHILKFGKPAPGGKTPPKKNTKVAVANDAEVDNKWQNEKSDEDVLRELLNDHSKQWIPFPSMEDIELVESRGFLMTPPDLMLRELYRLLGKYLHVDERQFMKGARLKDESSSNIGGTDIR